MVDIDFNCHITEEFSIKDQDFDHLELCTVQGDEEYVEKVLDEGDIIDKDKVFLSLYMWKNGKGAEYLHDFDIGADLEEVVDSCKRLSKEIGKPLKVDVVA